MYFVYTDFVETEKFQYLKIPKNASSSIFHTINETTKCWWSADKNLNKVKWTVIRDPFERFISGLKYDLQRQGLKLNEIKINEAFTSNYTNPKNGNQGNLNHASSQIPYLINTDIDYYVHIKDVSTFLKMHFNTSKELNKTTDEYYLDIDKEEIMKYLILDYKIYNHIIHSAHLWSWQQGRIF